MNSGIRAKGRLGLGSGRGFTLVEALVALLVGLLVLFGIHKIIVAGVKTQTTTSVQTELNRSAQVSMDDLVSRLRGSSGVVDTLADRISFTDQEGDNVKYWVEDGELYRAINASKYDDGILMAEDVIQLAFDYLDVDGSPGAGAEQAVRVAVELALERARHSTHLQSAVKLRNK